MFQEHESARLSVAPLEFVHFRALAMAPTSPLWQQGIRRTSPAARDSQSRRARFCRASAPNEFFRSKTYHYGDYLWGVRLAAHG